MIGRNHTCLGWMAKAEPKSGGHTRVKAWIMSKITGTYFRRINAGTRIFFYFLFPISF